MGLGWWVVTGDDEALVHSQQSDAKHWFTLNRAMPRTERQDCRCAPGFSCFLAKPRSRLNFIAADVLFGEPPLFFEFYSFGLALSFQAVAMVTFLMELIFIAACWPIWIGRRIVGWKIPKVKLKHAKEAKSVGKKQ